jgi:hypothetical protein
MALGLGLRAAPQIARPFYVGCHMLACCVGFLVGNALLAAVYLLLFVPFGLVMRVLRRRALSRGFDRSAPSYWRDAAPRADPERYYRQF